MLIHARTRLFCELHRAQRWLTQQDFLMKWLMEETDHYEIVEVESRERVEILWSTRDASSKTFRDRVVLHMMLCASRTQYCTEIHVVAYPDSERFHQEVQGDPASETARIHQWQADTLAQWKRRLENLRKCVNGDWVIEDRDLNRSVLLKSRL